MNKAFRHWIFLGIVVIGTLTLLMLTACKPETGSSPLATPVLGQASAFTSPRPTPPPVTPWPTATLLPDRGVRTTMAVELQPNVKRNWKQFTSLAFDGHNLVASVDDGTGKILPVVIDLETQQAEVLDENPNQAWIHDVHISKPYTVWTVSRGQLDTLYVRNTQTGQISAGVEGIHRTALSGNTVVGEQLGNSWDIWGYDIAGNKSFPIITRKDAQTGPLISGRWVVYRDAADKDDFGIGLYAVYLDTGEDIRLGSVYASSSEYVPPLYAIDVPWVAWSTGQRSKMPDLHFYNLDTHTAFTATVPSCGAFLPDKPSVVGRPEYLLLSGSTLIFSGCYQDLGFDIERKVFFSLPTYTSDMQGSMWVGWTISGNQLVLQRKVRHGILLRQLPSWKETEDHAYRDCSRYVPSAGV